MTDYDHPHHSTQWSQACISRPEEIGT
jgi:hypothetical protein